MNEEERRRRVRELLVPGGEPLGRLGRSRSGTVRAVAGGRAEAEALFAPLKSLGEAEEATGYPGRFVNFGGENRIGLRLDSRSGEPTMDVTVTSILEIEKLKFERGHETD